MFKKLSFLIALGLFLQINTAYSQQSPSNIIEEDVVEEEVLEEEVLEDESVDSEVTSENLQTQQAPKPQVKKKVDSELTGNFRGDYRFFPKSALYPGQKNEYFSAVFNPEGYIEWANGKKLIQFKGFARLNQYDNQQTHSDIRELYYQQVFKKWELSLGIKKIYWGFTESNHLVNVINQDDVLEGSDIENKLGQPMAHASITKKWGVVDVMLMSYFRELQFPGTAGRLRPPFNLLDNANYESSLNEYNPDAAVRWSHSIKDYDFAISHFYGTSRLPLFTTLDGFNFSPSYELIHQTGFELQATKGSMLYKLEAIHRESKRKTITAFTAGGEYTFSNVFKADVGLLLEYNFDDRGGEAISGLDDDIFVGMRIALNDKQSTDFLGGANIDREDGTITYFAKASRRIGNSWKASAETLGFTNVQPGGFLYLFRNDSFIQFSLAHYF